MAFKDKIFPLFGEYKGVEDSFKDAQGKGVFENFNLVLGEDLDALIDKVDRYIENLFFYKTIQDDKIVFFLEHNGCYLDTTLYSNDQLRSLMRFLPFWNNTRGTKLSYEVGLRWLGFDSVTIVEDFNIYTFDSPLTFDSPIRPTFDSSRKCKSCTNYEIHLTGTIPLTPQLFRQIKDVIRYVEPITAKLRKITYNGFDITNGQFLFFTINEFGNLIFTTLYPDWGGAFELQGTDLVVSIPADLVPFWNFQINPFAKLILQII